MKARHFAHDRFRDDMPLSEPLAVEDLRSIAYHGNRWLWSLTASASHARLGAFELPIADIVASETEYQIRITEHKLTLALSSKTVVNYSWRWFHKRAPWAEALAPHFQVLDESHESIFRHWRKAQREADFAAIASALMRASTELEEILQRIPYPFNVRFVPTDDLALDL